MTADAQADRQSSLFAPAEAMTVYEQPLNERIRAFLRLEHLFDLIAQNINGPTEWNSRAAMGGLIEVNDLLSRVDLKAELIKELERHASVVAGYQQNPGVDPGRLQEILDELSDLLTTLRSNACQPAQILRKDELVYAIKQRLPIPGGTCNFDLPAYHHWLTRPVQSRIEHLHYWFNDLRVIKDGLDLALKMVRESATPSVVVAEGGFYQQPVDANVACQLVRVILPGDIAVFPEISGGKHRFTIRFLEQPNTSSRPTQTEMDVRFDLQCCNL